MHWKKQKVIKGQNFNNLRYADDAVFLSDKSTQLQRIIDKVVRVCNDYSMEINVNKTKVMGFSKKQDRKSVTEVNGEKLEQVSGYKYLGSWVTEDGKSEKEVKARIGMAKGAFWKLKELKGSVQIPYKFHFYETEKNVFKDFKNKM